MGFSFGHGTKSHVASVGQLTLLNKEADDNDNEVVQAALDISAPQPVGAPTSMQENERDSC